MVPSHIMLVSLKQHSYRKFLERLFPTEQHSRHIQITCSYKLKTAWNSYSVGKFCQHAWFLLGTYVALAGVGGADVSADVQVLDDAIAPRSVDSGSE